MKRVKIRFNSLTAIGKVLRFNEEIEFEDLLRLIIDKLGVNVNEKAHEDTISNFRLMLGDDVEVDDISDIDNGDDLVLLRVRPDPHRVSSRSENTTDAPGLQHVDESDGNPLEVGITPTNCSVAGQGAKSSHLSSREDPADSGKQQDKLQDKCSKMDEKATTSADDIRDRIGATGNQGTGNLDDNNQVVDESASSQCKPLSNLDQDSDGSIQEGEADIGVIQKLVREKDLEVQLPAHGPRDPTTKDMASSEDQSGSITQVAAMSGRRSPTDQEPFVAPTGQSTNHELRGEQSSTVVQPDAHIDRRASSDGTVAAVSEDIVHQQEHLVVDSTSPRGHSDRQVTETTNSSGGGPIGSKHATNGIKIKQEGEVKVKEEEPHMPEVCCFGESRSVMETSTQLQQEAVPYQQIQPNKSLHSPTHSTSLVDTNRSTGNLNGVMASSKQVQIKVEKVEHAMESASIGQCFDAETEAPSSNHQRQGPTGIVTGSPDMVRSPDEQRGTEPPSQGHAEGQSAADSADLERLQEEAEEEEQDESKENGEYEADFDGDGEEGCNDDKDFMQSEAIPEGEEQQKAAATKELQSESNEWIPGFFSQQRVSELFQRQESEDDDAKNRQVDDRPSQCAGDGAAAKSGKQSRRKPLKNGHHNVNIMSLVVEAAATSKSSASKASTFQIQTQIKCPGRYGKQIQCFRCGIQWYKGTQEGRPNIHWPDASFELWRSVDKPLSSFVCKKTNNRWFDNVHDAKLYACLSFLFNRTEQFGPSPALKRFLEIPGLESQNEIGLDENIASYGMYVLPKNKVFAVGVRCHDGTTGHFLLDEHQRRASEIYHCKPMGLAKRYGVKSKGKRPFRGIANHLGPIHYLARDYKGSSYNVLVRWANGSLSQEPLDTFAKYAWDVCYEYANENRLLDFDGWKFLLKRRQQKKPSGKRKRSPNGAGGGRSSKRLRESQPRGEHSAEMGSFKSSRSR